jgi:hypothetical protein
MIKDIKFIPDENQEKRKGLRYSITLFQDNEQTLQLRDLHNTLFIKMGSANERFL